MSPEDLEELKKAQDLSYSRRLDKLRNSPTTSPNHSSPLNNDVMRVKGTSAPKPEVMKTISGDSFTDKIARLRKGGSQALKGVSKGGLKAVPILGSVLGLGAALSSGDAAAALPVFGDVDSLGPEDALEKKLEDGTITPEERAILMSRFNR